MITQITFLKGDLEPSQKRIANYFGLPVEVIDRMETWSLIRYLDRKFIVSTEDLQDWGAMRLVA